jgi:hypothetical protein
MRRLAAEQRISAFGGAPVDYGHEPQLLQQLQRELGFEFPASLPPAGDARPSEFATRAQLAQALCRQLDRVLPARSRDFAFADLTDEQQLEAASRLRQAGIMSGIGSMDGVSLFEPERMVAREEFEEILLRALVASGVEAELARAAIARSRAGRGHPAEPLRAREMEHWMVRLAAALGEGTWL